MRWEIWLAYALASFVLLIIPGPTILLVVGQSPGQSQERRQGSGRAGRWAAVWLTVWAVVLGDFTAFCLSMAGLGAALSASAGVFTVLKWVGAAYLIWLGLRMWRAGPLHWDVEHLNNTSDATKPGAKSVTGKGRFKDALHVFTVTALNPKGILFFVAFVPQFIAPTEPVLPQMVLLGATFLALGALSTAAYALAADSLAQRLTRPGASVLVNRFGGGLLMGAGAMTAALKQAG